MRNALITALACVAIAGCSLPGAKSRPMDRYTLSPEIATGVTPAAAKCDAVLRVTAVQAAPPWSSDSLLYTQTPYQLSAFAYHRWVSPPAGMLTDAIVRALAASGLYRAVLGPTDPGNGDLTLGVRLVRGPVQGFPAGADAGGAGSSTESLSLSASLAVAASGKLLGAREFSAQATAGANPYAGVVAANRLAGRLIGELTGWLGGLAAGGHCQGGG